MRRRVLLFICLMLLRSADVTADQEAFNHTYVSASKYGQFYAKSVPAADYGLEGTTRVYRVESGEDVLLQTYDWYAPQMFVYGFLGTNDVYIVRIGPWSRGHEAQADHPAIAFYKNDKLLKEYSTLDVAGRPDNVSSSVSHYTVVLEYNGFRQPYGNQLMFDLVTTDDRLLSYDCETGALINDVQEQFMKDLYEADTKIRQLKWQWYEKNKETVNNADKYGISQDDIDQAFPAQFPIIPQGYFYVVGGVWDPVVLEKKQ